MEEIVEEDLLHCQEDGLIRLAKSLGIDVDEKCTRTGLWKRSLVDDVMFVLQSEKKPKGGWTW